ncbi:hypothetical protein KO02_11500 [Sphingobacterium sp. ML3W]|uniref:hypothetical protein n=1 Tax=Sphingobacterium sp. ML3W TaxID=1538644 RepID=UPI0004F60735|nr:hypothetical protein [Sphingobacterium sp. ML3W]AIM37245.1 hypothetical protein KO02_11500 [Sphingobacterium sp. ML3W]
MKTLNFIKKYALAMVAAAVVITFSAFKATGVNIQQARYTVAVYFDGDETNQAQVEDSSNWTTTPNSETCDGANELACMQLVEHTDLTGTSLDPVKIALGAQNTPSGYIPTRTGGTSPTPFRAINRT